MDGITVSAIVALSISAVCLLLLLFYATRIRPEAVNALTYAASLFYALCQLGFLAIEGYPENLSVGEKIPPSTLCVAEAYVINALGITLLVGVECILHRIFRIFSGAKKLDDRWYLTGIGVLVVLWSVCTLVPGYLEGFPNVVIHNGLGCDIVYVSTPGLVHGVIITCVVVPGTVMSVWTWTLWIKDLRHTKSVHYESKTNVYLRILIISSFFILAGLFTAYSYYDAYGSQDAVYRTDQRMDPSSLMICVTGIIFFCTFATTRDFWHQLLVHLRLRKPGSSVAQHGSMGTRSRSRRESRAHASSAAPAVPVIREDAEAPSARHDGDSGA